ncbi:MAG: DUF2844 domain-containing protein [Steroidobacteraceae bacterium]
MRSHAKFSAAFVSLLVIACAPRAAHAALGADAGSISQDRAHFKAALRTQVMPAYTVHTLDLPGGTVVREFIGASGVVFAVSWSGPFRPDLRQTLGVYFDRFHAAIAQPAATHRQLLIAERDVVIASRGRLRAFEGLAYLPAEMPAGVTPAQLR